MTQAIAGLGGIGKTQLALEYTYRYKSDYKIVWWLAAENPVTLESEYAELARDLGLTSGEETELSELIKKVRYHLGNRSDWLLVFDNAGDKKSITSFLPQGTSGHVVITSRNKDWQGVAKSLTVYKWDRAESIDYLIKRTRIEDREGANKLAKTLGDLPLALAQASAYIAQRSLIDSYEKYLSRYKTNRQKIREREHQPLNYDEKVETTWLMNFEQVEKESRAGILLLKICSFLAPEGIPQLLFTGLCDPSGDEERPHIEDKIELEEGLEILASYSLIDFQGDEVSIHRLVQEVMIDQLEKDEKYAICSLAIDLVLEIWPEERYESWSQIEPLLPHVESLVEHTSSYDLQTDRVASLLLYVAIYFNDIGQYNLAEPLYERALAIREKVLGEEHPDTATTLNNLAWLYESQGRYDEAEPLYERALAIYEKVLGEEHPDTATTLDNLAGLYRNQGRYDEAEPLYERALAIREKVLGEEHPDTATTLHNLAGLYGDQGRYDEAEPLYERALAISEKVLGEQHPHTASTLNNLAGLYRNQGRYDEAEPLYERALAISEKVLGEEHPDTASTLHNLAGLYESQGRYDEAEPLYERALAISEKVLGEEHPDTATTLNNLAGLYESQGRYDEAEPLYERALDHSLYEKVLGEQHPYTASTLLNNLAQVLYESQGRYDEAEPLYERALAIQRKGAR